MVSSSSSSSIPWISVSLTQTLETISVRWALTKLLFRHINVMVLRRKEQKENDLEMLLLQDYLKSANAPTVIGLVFFCLRSLPRQRVVALLCLRARRFTSVHEKWAQFPHQ